MKCPLCKEKEMYIVANITAAFPSSWEYRLSKTKIKKKEFELLGVFWDSADYICPKCGKIGKTTIDEMERQQ